MPTGNRQFVKRDAFSLLELLAVATLLGIIALLVVPRIRSSADDAKAAADARNRATINAAVERWHLEKGEWPKVGLNDIGVDPEYFPEGIPKNPVTGGKYTLHPHTHRVKGN